MFNRILVPLDGSKTAEQALPYARYLAQGLSVPIELLAAVDTESFSAHGEIDKTHPVIMVQEEEVERAESYLQSIAGNLSGLMVTRSVKRGYAGELIIDEASKDEGILITMATHGRSGLRRWLLGSTAEKVLRGAANPVLLVRANEKAENLVAASFKTVIVPLDGSRLAESILPSVVALAKALSLDVVLIRAFRIPANMYAGGEGYYGIDLDNDRKEFEAEARDYLKEKQHELTALGVSRVSMACPEGFSADEIIALGQKTDGALIAMCTHGRSGVTRWAMGSVTETVLRHASAPVLCSRVS